MSTRSERDSMGEVAVPEAAYYGASTQRAVDNFPISGIGMGRRMIEALGMIKAAAARVNGEIGAVDTETAAAIADAAEEVVVGRHDGEFVLDVFQTGSGTSTNMNANEVIANRAGEILGAELGSRRVHPNDQVNAGQSSNDVIPSAIHVAAASVIHGETIPALRRLAAALSAKATEFDGVVKSGRTHLMDATPVRLGQEFGGYATQVTKSAERLEAALEGLYELALGGTAVGTGINAPPGFAGAVVANIAERTGLPFRTADDYFEAMGAKDAAVHASAALRGVAVALFKVANDVRWLGSGPRTAIGEIALPETQPGSSIMPGKVNPVMSEMVMQVAAQVVGNDATVAWAGANGNFELNVMMPVLAHNLLQSAELLAAAADTFRERCVEGIRANEERSRWLVEQNIIVVTALVPHIGYDAAAKVAKEAFASGRGVREVVLDTGLMEPDELDRALDLRKMTEGGVVE
ncbi:MAG TPA: class II fumarate hydratase [Acidimicrobiia bacterium]|nr:class II fumarate hydratase [Acidimicrobiia bacterium]